MPLAFFVKRASALVGLQVDDDVPRDITGPEFPPMPGADPNAIWDRFFPFFIFVVVVLVVLLVVFLRRPKSRRTKASDRALRQLDRLQALQLVAKNQAERHFTLLAGILRRFLQKGFGVAAARSTTNEFLEAAARNSLLERHLPFLCDFMKACDIAKFAPPAMIDAAGKDLDDKLRVWLASQSATEKPRRT